MTLLLTDRSRERHLASEGRPLYEKSILTDTAPSDERLGGLPVLLTSLV